MSGDRLPMRPDFSCYLDAGCPDKNNVLLERAVAAGIVRWIDRQEAPGWWKRNLIETYCDCPPCEASQWRAWQDVTDQLWDHMQAARWLEGQFNPHGLWMFATELAANYFYQGCLWSWEVQP